MTVSTGNDDVLKIHELNKIRHEEWMKIRHDEWENAYGEFTLDNASDDELRSIITLNQAIVDTARRILETREKLKKHESNI